MKSWRAGDLQELLSEGSTIQHRLTRKKKFPCSDVERLRKAFIKEMSKGNTKAALRLLSTENRGSILQLEDIVPGASSDDTTVLDILKSKHPPGISPTEDSLVEGAYNPPSTVHLALPLITCARPLPYSPDGSVQPLLTLKVLPH